MTTCTANPIDLQLTGWIGQRPKVDAYPIDPAHLMLAVHRWPCDWVPIDNAPWCVSDLITGRLVCNAIHHDRHHVAEIALDRLRTRARLDGVTVTALLAEARAQWRLENAA